MNYQPDLALAKQAFERILALCEPERVQTWQPTPEQRATYIQLAEQVLEALSGLETVEKRHLFKDGQLQNVIPDTLLAFVREQLRPRSPSLRKALDYLDADPGNKLLRELLLDPPPGTGKRIWATFEEGIQQIYELIERNPDRDHLFMPETAYEILDSKLIQFEPDAWLNRVGELRPIRTHKRNLVLPSHIRLRLEELYRAYVFGLWLSVFGLSRAILEYAILDNLNKFGIDPAWPPERDGSRKAKKLSHLVDELAVHFPRHRESMDLLRDYGNEYLHPKKSPLSKETLLLRRQASAKEVVEKLVEVVEAIYVAPAVNSSSKQGQVLK
jgi:hypothetical protein